jgi:hypothetical protein
MQNPMLHLPKSIFLRSRFSWQFHVLKKGATWQSTRKSLQKGGRLEFGDPALRKCRALLSLHRLIMQAVKDSEHWSISTDNPGAWERRSAWEHILCLSSRLRKFSLARERQSSHLARILIVFYSKVLFRKRSIVFIPFLPLSARRGVTHHAMRPFGHNGAVVQTGIALAGI